MDYIRRNLTIMLILIYSLLAILLSTPYTTLMPVFTDDILKVEATGMGLSSVPPPPAPWSAPWCWPQRRTADAACC